MGLLWFALSVIFFPLSASVMSGFIALAGLIWAPFGALICARAASRRGLQAHRYAVAGAAFSVLYLVPWFYLVLRMHNKYVPRFVIWCVYFILYIPIWLFGVIGLGLFLLAFAFDTSSWQGANLTLVRYFLIAQVLVTSFFWIVSLRRLLRMNRYDNYFPPTHDWDPLLPHSTYVLPFVYALAGSVLMFLTAWLGAGFWR